MTSDKQPDDNKRKRHNRIGIFLLVAISVWFAYQMSQSRLLSKGEQAPDWSLRLADGSKKTLGMKDMAGKVLVVEFLSLGCPHCVREQSELSELLRKKGRQGVEVVGILVGEELSDVEEYYKERRPDFPLVVDPGSAAASYKVDAFPTIYVIDRSGKVADSNVGFWKLEDMAEAVSAAISGE